MDSNLESQQPLAEQPFGVVVVRAASNRMQDLLQCAFDAARCGARVA
jgi:hypothetical protein